jgi:hypothetical protein
MVVELNLLQNVTNGFHACYVTQCYVLAVGHGERKSGEIWQLRVSSKCGDVLLSKIFYCWLLSCINPVSTNSMQQSASYRYIHTARTDIFVFHRTSRLRSVSVNALQ